MRGRRDIIFLRVTFGNFDTSCVKCANEIFRFREIFTAPTISAPSVTLFFAISEGADREITDFFLRKKGKGSGNGSDYDISLTAQKEENSWRPT